MTNNYRRLTHGENGAWGLKYASNEVLLNCAPSLYGACAKLYDLEKQCADVAEAKTREDVIYELQQLVDIGLGGHFVDLEKILGGGKCLKPETR